MRNTKEDFLEEEKTPDPIDCLDNKTDSKYPQKKVSHTVFGMMTIYVLG